MSNIRIGNKNAKHLYEVVVSSDGGKIEVDANNRKSAEAIAIRAGYIVHSVNMVG